MTGRIYKQWTKHVLSGVVALTLIGSADRVLGQEGRLYIGTTGAFELVDAAYAKATDNTDPRNISPQRGKVYHERDSDAETGYGVSVLAGYRRLLGQSGLYLSGEFYVTLQRVTVRGRQAGVGESAGRNQYGESWPDGWALEKDGSYGFTLKIGSRPAELQR